MFGLPLGGTLVKVPFAIGVRLHTSPLWGSFHHALQLSMLCMWM